ncbi:MAG TPA: copper resistance protein CopC [Gemmatimonadaceae bacterium]
MRSKSLLLGSTLAIAAIAICWRAAEAHATLLSSDPAANAKLAVAPTRIRLKFSEPVDASVSSVQLVASSGIARTLRVASDPHDVAALLAPIDGALRGSYRVVWRTVSVDGHPVDGSFLISVADTSRAPAAIPPPAPASVDRTTFFSRAVGFTRGATILLLMSTLGILWFGRLAGASEARAVRLCSWLAIAALVAMTVHFIVWATGDSPRGSFDPGWIGRMAETRPGRLEIVRWFAMALVVWALVLARRPSVGLLFGAVAVGVSGAIGHPSALVNPALAIPVSVAHLFAASVWLGGLSWLAIVGRTETSRMPTEAHRVSEIALWSVIAVFLTGGAQTLLFVTPMGDLFRTAYGQVLMLKIAGVLMLVGIGAYHRYRVVPRVQAGGFGASLRAEIVLMAIVIVIAGVLASLSPRPATPQTPPSALAS